MSIEDSELFVPESEPLTVKGLIDWLNQFDGDDEIVFADTIAGNHQKLQNIKPYGHKKIIFDMQEPVELEH